MSKRSIVIICVVLLLALAGWQAYKNVQYKRYIRKAASRLYAVEPARKEAAAEYFAKAKALYPNRLDTIYLDALFKARSMYLPSTAQQRIDIFTPVIKKLNTIPPSKISMEIPGYVDMYFNRAAAYNDIGDKESALKDINAIIKIGGGVDTNPQTLAIADLYCGAGEYDEALKWREQYVKDNKESHYVLHMLAIIKTRQGKYDEALKALAENKKVLDAAVKEGKTKPGSPMELAIYTREAKALLGQKKYKEALAASNKAIKGLEDYKKTRPEALKFPFYICGLEDAYFLIDYKTRAEIKKALGDSKGAEADLKKDKEYQATLAK
ncbi:tetratricopeptide (TPR) repeat protein [Elusimicrobium simillimum]|uniref:tetratricopeptide repeat protein n=1 Tax=Elusimicrobium simillimum TaxID=3143438 RepID=UPI003C6F69C6